MSQPRQPTRPAQARHPSPRQPQAPSTDPAKPPLSQRNPCGERVWVRGVKRRMGRRDPSPTPPHKGEGKAALPSLLSVVYRGRCRSPPFAPEHCARLRPAGAAGRYRARRRRGRTAGARRAERLGQIDAPEDHGRADRARPRRARPAPGHHHPLSAAGARPLRVRHHARLCRGRPRARATTSTGRNDLSRRARLHRRGGPGAALRRRGAPRGARPSAGARARRADPRRADQPSRPAGHRMAGGGAAAHRAPLSCWSATTAGCCTTLSRATLWLDRGTIRRLDRGFERFRGWRDEMFEQEERDRQKLDRKIAGGAALDALRRDGAALAQHGPRFARCTICAASAASRCASPEKSSSPSATPRPPASW